MTSSLATVAYLGATILFILSLGGLSHPETARRGNMFGICVICTFFAANRPMLPPTTRAPTIHA